MHTPAYDAISRQSWAQPLRIDIAAGIIRLRVDSGGVFHIVYVNRGLEPGVYHVRSDDQGSTWSEPAWLDPDIPPTHTPTALNFEPDESGGLHAVWFYGPLDEAARPDWVRYVNSLDGGNTWSAPFTIDQFSQEGEHNLTVAGPIMTVTGRTVHVIWAAGSLPYRYHRFSPDAGQSWSPPRRIFGELHGQAGDGFAVDGAGRVHFLGQIRYPVGIYHSIFDAGRWSSPSLLYQIAQGDFGEVSGDRIHAHGLNPVVRAGNQLVLTFGDGPADPNRRLFAMHRTLADVMPSELRPMPQPATRIVDEPGPTLEGPTPEPSVTMPASSYDVAGQPPGSVPPPNQPLRVALIPTLLLIVGTVAVRLFSGRLRRSLSRLFR
jgi:hypothetical protein